MSITPRRSVLYMPANNARALDKAKTLPADCIVIDLEDAVSPTAKTEARAQAIAAVNAGGFGHREVAVRINAQGTPWFDDDLAACATSAAKIVVLPKVETAETVQAVAARLPEHVVLWAMIETPCGVMQVEAIAAATPRLQVLVMGTSDLSKELRIPPRADRAALQYALSRCVCAARGAGIDIIDGVHLNFRDTEAFAAVCEQGKWLGFDGKSLIHPDQVALANQVFAPSLDEVAHAQQVLAAWKAAEVEGSGMAVLDGKLIENLHAAEAERILRLYEAINTSQSM
ncbi:MAG: CoA ester lyase [Pseudomonadales bacterium]